MTAKDLEIIKLDIEIADNLLYPVPHKELSRAALNQAAYHSTQAIEKGIKAIIRDTDEFASLSLKTHNIERLLIKAEQSQEGFINNHKYISDNAYELTAFNELRYGDYTIDEHSAFILYKEATSFAEELEALYVKQGHNLESLHKDAKKEYGSSAPIKLNNESSKYDNSKKQRSFPKNDNAAFRKGFQNLQQEPQNNKQVPTTPSTNTSEKGNIAADNSKKTSYNHNNSHRNNKPPKNKSAPNR